LPRADLVFIDRDVSRKNDMNSDRSPLDVETFFLPETDGSRYCVLHRPRKTPRGAVVYVHPFAEEMNKARRMAALQARRMATEGYGVLQIDLLGCGDSSGDFADATWDNWCSDVAHAVRLIEERIPDVPLVLWGLRLGALIALSAASMQGLAPRCFLLWQPIISGRAYLREFIRIHAVGQMLSGKPSEGIEAIRERLLDGQSVEIAGYTLSAALARSMDGVRIESMLGENERALWWEVTADGRQALRPVVARAVSSLTDRGARVDLRRASGEPFWHSVEIEECPSLIDATIQGLQDVLV